MPPEQNPKAGKVTNGDVPSHVLWIGNLSSDSTDADLLRIFGKYGALDTITSPTARSYAFIYFRALDGAKAAKDALQGTVVHGNPIRIEFARPAKPCKLVWIGAIGSSVTKEQLEGELMKFGKLEEFRFFRERNTAIANYFKMEDAITAVRNLNAKSFGGQQIRVDYLRSQPSKRDNLNNFRDPRDGHFFGRKNMGPPSTGWKNLPVGARKEDGMPSNILHISFPPAVQVDEQMLHNAMILFGEIERIRNFPSRHYSFVEFRSVEEARRAKEGLEGRLFNDPRIQIVFANREIVLANNHPQFYPGVAGPRPDMFFGEHPFLPGPSEMFGHPVPAGLNFRGPPPGGMQGPIMRPFGVQNFDGHTVPPEVYGNLNKAVGPNWRTVCPPIPTIPPLVPGTLPPFRPMWDGFDVNPCQREPKRSRIEGISPVGNQGISDEYGPGNVQIPVQQTPFLAMGGSTDHPPHVEPRGLPEIDHCWRGIIAKGGSPVCTARCIPIGKGVDTQLPEVVNCSARTGLDMLTKHYAEANGFDVVYFLPDSEEDFASYTDFLRYLSGKSRAGVAKFDDGTTFFLVPPSEFLTKVLKISGPERLYGVVLKFPQPQVNVPQPPLPSHHMEGPPIPPMPSQDDSSLVPQNESRQVLPMDQKRFLHESSVAQPSSVGSSLAIADESRFVQGGLADYGNGGSAFPPQAGVTLTPELIATLAALLPANAQPSASAPQLPLHSTVMMGPSADSQGWKQEEMNNQMLHLGHQTSGQTHHLSHFPSFPNAGNAVSNIGGGSEHPTQNITNGSQIEDPSMKIQQSAAVPTPQMLSFMGHSQSVQFTTPESSQQLISDPSQSSQLGCATGLFRPPLPQQPNPATVSSSSGGSIFQHPPGIPLATHQMNSEYPLQLQQTTFSAPVPNQLEVEADKNYQYQSTLQFAASLLLQLQQQQQQQANAQSMQGGSQH